MASLALRYATVAIILLTLLGCDGAVRERPYGWMRIGPLSEYTEERDYYLRDNRILLRHDSEGFSAMSTECTSDLSGLVGQKTGSTLEFVNQYNGSRYDYEGRVIRGPAKANLPYYQVKLDRSAMGGALDTLYVYVGEERPPSWRFVPGDPIS